MFTTEVPEINFDELVYTGPVFQSGSGLLSSLRKLTIPLIRRARPYIAKTAMAAAKNIARKLADGEPLGKAIKRTAGEMSGKLLNDFAGSGRKKRKTDIFDQ